MEPIDLDRAFSEPIRGNKRDPLVKSRFFKVFTYVVNVLSLLWILAIDWFHLAPSRLTLTLILFALMFYTGEFNGWKRPFSISCPKRERKHRRQPNRQHRQRGYHWIERDVNDNS